MYFKIQVVIDAADPAKLADFWAFALDYVLEPPPHGFETWEEFGRSIGMPEEEFGDQAAVIDPADEGSPDLTSSACPSAHDRQEPGPPRRPGGRPRDRRRGAQAAGQREG